MTVTAPPRAYPDDEFSSRLDALVPRWRESALLGYLPGLDGIRALSAAAVVAYHLDYEWSAGGYLGVEVFFVLSGFLITRLLLDERRRTGTVDRLRFWGRRARRLLPAIVVLVVGVCAYAALALPDGELAAFRGDAIASLLYVQNWHAILADQPYFEAFGRPSPLRHVWSLAIEEQFYLLWPLVLPWALRRFGSRITAAGVAVAIACSALLMSATADIAAPERAYYGTDTRAFGILLGCLLAFWWRPERARGDIGRGARTTVDAIGGIALVLLLWQLVHRSEFDPWTYPEGFLLVDVCTLVLLVVASHPASRLTRMLGAGWLAALGRRSYSIYLWHWPVIVFTRPGVDWGLEGTSALVARLAIIAALSEASYRWVEQPFRDGRVQRLAASFSGRFGVIAVRRTALVGATAGLLLFVGVLAVPAPATPVETVRAPIDPPVASTAPAATTPTTEQPTAPVSAGDAAPSPTTTTATTQPPQPTPEATASARPAVTVIGESVTLGAVEELQAMLGPGVHVDAAEGRRASDSIARTVQLANEGLLAPLVFVHIGNNGAIPANGFDEVIAAAGEDTRLVFVTVRVLRRWEGQVNTEVQRVADQYDNVRIANWNRVIATQGEHLVVDDGVHLSAEGKQAYAELLQRFLEP